MKIEALAAGALPDPTSLPEADIFPEVALTLERLMLDEDCHREEAGDRRGADSSLVCRLWQRVVAGGSAAAVVAARWI